jgi:hypothetical protein
LKVPDDHPLWEACKALDIDVIKSLFSSGLASPFDRKEDGSTPLAIVFEESVGWGDDQVVYKASQESSQTTMLCARSLSLLSFLSNYIDFDDGIQPYFRLFRALDKIEICRLGGRSATFVASVLRIMLSKNCFPDRSSVHPIYAAYALTLDQKDSEVDQVLKSYSVHELPVFKAFFDSGGHLNENSKQMLEDPEALLLQPMSTDGRSWTHYDIWDKGFSATPILTLLCLPILCPTKYASALRYCCLTRLAILLRHDKLRNPRLLHHRTSFHVWSKNCARKLHVTKDSDNIYSGYCSPLEFARIIGQIPLLDNALVRAGWSQQEIDAIHDTEIFIGVERLLGGQIIYMTKQECQSRFKEQLCSGRFDRLEDNLYEISCEWAASLQIYWYNIQCVIKSANLALRLKTTPGAFPSEIQEDTVLVPGVDFECFCGPWRPQQLWCVCDRYK